MSGRRHKSSGAWPLWRGHRQSNYRMSCVIRSAADAVALAHLFISNFSSLLRLLVQHLSGCQRHLDEMDTIISIASTWKFYCNFSAIGSWISNYFKQMKLRCVYSIKHSVWKCLCWDFFILVLWMWTLSAPSLAVFGCIWIIRGGANIDTRRTCGSMLCHGPLVRQSYPSWTKT